MKYFMFTFLLILGSANAGERSSALKIICMPMNAKPEFYNCIQTIAKYTYFEDNALKICATMTANTDKVDCMDTVGNVAFTNEEIKLCAAALSDIEKQDCLNAHGSVHEL
jgi:hypothetical protein